jgi:GDPmannose 4,6-dehydratase
MIALITGVGGQDGSYLAEFLLAKQYEVHGIMRYTSLPNTERIAHLFNNPSFHLHYGDVTQHLTDLIRQIQPHEIYNLAGQSQVKVSFDIPEYTNAVNGLGVLHILDAVKSLGLNSKIYQASTSELFGSSPAPQNEETPLNPQSPYAVSKLYGYWMVKNYRDAYNMFCCNGILFNHESPRRGIEFVSRKITKAVAEIHHGISECLILGNLDAKRDWGHSRDYVECMWLILQKDNPDDYVMGTGKCYKVREFVEKAFKEINYNITWHGSGLNEIGVDQHGITRIKVSKKFFRPLEVHELRADTTKTTEKLNWNPTITFEQLVSEMVQNDLKITAQNKSRFS